MRRVINSYQDVIIFSGLPEKELDEKIKRLEEEADKMTEWEDPDKTH